MSQGLATQLREGTQQSHTLAENTAYMKCFLKGIVEREPFRKLLTNLYFVYTTLETELRRYAAHPVVGPVYRPELERKAALEEDLAFYYGTDWRTSIAPSVAGSIYVARIQEVAETDPALLVAHAYVRYMGDLSGGQSLRNIVRSALELPDGYGTRFYDFDQIPTVEARRAFKGQYRDALDTLPIDQEIAERIVAEANHAFKLNRDVMHDLEADVREAIGEHVFDLVTRQDRPGSTEKPRGGHPVALVTAE
jgi:heme oxygenase